MSTTTKTASSQPTVELTDLDLQQLAEIKKQLEEELSHLTNSFAQLKQAQNKFQACIVSVDAVKSGNADAEKVIVDVGTGYYVEKSTDDAIKFFTDKVEYVKKNLESLQQTITTKQNNLRATLDVMQMKISLGSAAAGASAPK
ncbi:535_t:CDS:2 [Ambispora gerdemannii]|uniref:535_t:CDS:1 n=1 Tax=Ambispora gerdemannii TaxID=144530 RepID=A0A9N8V336_9GLOM|nr:535_t:CDS:2 [Ambispora gerdemannii]